MQTIQCEIRSRLPVGRESRRLFHGRGHCFPGYEDLLIDWYAPVLLLSLYAPREEDWLQQLVRMLLSEVSKAKTILLQERFLLDGPVRTLYGNPPEEMEVVEADLRYRLRIGKAMNIGFFPDMAVGRSLVRQLAKGKRVLNLFAYSCSFSVAALAGGAQQVVNLDMNSGALELGRLNHRINQLDLRQVSFLPLELFRSIGKLKKLGPFDLVICDPPAYQGKNFKAERDWPKLLRKLPDLLTGKGDLLACLNGPHLPPGFLTDLIAELRPELTMEQQLQPGGDFPEAEDSRGVWIFHYRSHRAVDQISGRS